MSEGSVCLVGIAGSSGSGKSTLAREAVAARPGQTALLALDSYYRVLTHLPRSERDGVNFDHPDALDWPLLCRHLDMLLAGSAIDRPVYRFEEHDRAAETELLEPARWVFLEGILVLHPEAVRDRLAFSVFVETPLEICFARRLERDIKERGRTQESVRRQWTETVEPMTREFVLPSRRHADLTVHGDRDLAASTAAVWDSLGALS